MRGLCDTMRTFRDSSRRFGESIRKPIANSSHPSEIGAYRMTSSVCCSLGIELAPEIRQFYRIFRTCNEETNQNELMYGLACLACMFVVLSRGHNAAFLTCKTSVSVT